MRTYIALVAVLVVIAVTSIWVRVGAQEILYTQNPLPIEDGHRVRCTSDAAELRVVVRARLSVDVLCIGPEVEITPTVTLTPIGTSVFTPTLTPIVTMTPTVTLPTVTPTSTFVVESPWLDWVVIDWSTADVVLRNPSRQAVRSIDFRLYPDPEIEDSLSSIYCTTETPDGVITYPAGWGWGAVYNYEQGFYGVRLAIQPQFAETIGVPIAGQNVWLLQCQADNADGVFLTDVVRILTDVTLE